MRSRGLRYLCPKVGSALLLNPGSLCALPFSSAFPPGLPAGPAAPLAPFCLLPSSPRPPFLPPSSFRPRSVQITNPNLLRFRRRRGEITLPNRSTLHDLLLPRPLLPPPPLFFSSSRFRCLIESVFSPCKPFSKSKHRDNSLRPSARPAPEVLRTDCLTFF